MRACAAIALGKIDSDASRRALQRSSSDKDPIIRNAVSRALRGGGSA
jgi:HEAT repeat protein